MMEWMQNTNISQLFSFVNEHVSYSFSINFLKKKHNSLIEKQNIRFNIQDIFLHYSIVINTRTYVDMTDISFFSIFITR